MTYCKEETSEELIDIRDNIIIKEITQGIDAIIHTTALHGKQADLNYSREKFIDTNIIGT